MTSIVESLLVPDLPVFLWWRDLKALGTELFEKLAEKATRAIVDSAASEEVAGSLNLIRAMVAQHRRTAFTDLAWTRVTPWRQLTAQFFDAPALAGYLPRLRKVTVEYVARNRNHEYVLPEAVFLAAWLADALGHSQAAVESRGGSARRLRFSGETGSLEFELRKIDGREDWIQSVRLEAEGEAVFRAQRTADGAGLATSGGIARLRPVQRIVRAVPRDTATALTRELELQKRDCLYEKVLSLACALSGPGP
jgi:glucose-6-phosphate dehydrogenase assembly protein OpcA